MHRLILLPLFSLVLSSLASSALDQLHIQNLLSDFALISDSGSLSGKPDFSGFDRVFTGNVTFDFGLPTGVIHGLANVEDIFRKNLPPGTITQNAVSTERITLVSAKTATAVSYDVDTYFGTGNLTGQIAVLYIRFDDTLVKTKLPGNGGWRIATRINKYFGNPFAIGNKQIYPPVVG